MIIPVDMILYLSLYCFVNNLVHLPNSTISRRRRIIWGVWGEKNLIMREGKNNNVAAGKGGYMLSFKIAFMDREWAFNGVVQTMADCDILRCYNNKL